MPPRQQPQQQPQQPQYVDPDHQRIAEFAEWLWDTDDDAETRDAFVSDAMTKRGYTPRTHTSWDPPASSDPQQRKPPGARPYFR